MISVILLIVAFVILIGAAINVPASPKVSMFPLGMAVWALSVLARGF